MTDSEKDRLRKIEHSQIEKTRRRKISNCLNRLKELVPKNREPESKNCLPLGTIQILTNTIEYLHEKKIKLDKFSKYDTPIVKTNNFIAPSIHNASAKPLFSTPYASPITPSASPSIPSASPTTTSSPALVFPSDGSTLGKTYQYWNRDAIRSDFYDSYTTPSIFTSTKYYKGGSNNASQYNTVYIDPTVPSFKRLSQDPNHPMRISNLIMS
ncbi:hypothetical protein BC833DRAFT_618779 [Globomyces pollinis-pini]|nr:hypothetical protein BC833DRAFT_618779 [Globomyces pollinis-pini]